MDQAADRRGDRSPHPRRPFVARPERIDGDGDWRAFAWAEPHWSIAVTNTETDDDGTTESKAYVTAHGPTCAQCRTIADVLQARQSPGRA